MVVGVTLEYQRRMAKELQDYFRQKKLEEAADRGPFFGFIAKNEIANGRLAMFGFAVGLLTEYADRLGFCSATKDPSLQFWNCGLELILLPCFSVVSPYKPVHLSDEF